jgi:quaternary ammonium compound-resistance protein SugE
MAWALLIAAGMAEVAMALALKHSLGWSRLGYGALGIAAALASIGMLTVAMRELPVGTAYAVFTGLGAVGVAAVGILFYEESASLLRIACIGLVITGAAGLKLVD